MGLHTSVMAAYAEPTVLCAKCWRHNPVGKAFCVDCGNTLSGAAASDDGATVLQATAEMLFKETDSRPAAKAAVGTVACAKCNTSLPETDRYCSSCGAPLEAKRPQGDTAPLGGFDLAIGKVRPRLAVLNADGSLRKAWPIASDVTLIGSREGDVLLERDPFVSPRHARVRRGGDRWLVEDLKSFNGTYRRILGSEELRPGDYIRAGAQVLRVTSYEELFGSHPPPVPSTVTKYLGSPVGAATVFYLAHVLENRRVGQLVSLDDSRPRAIGRKEGDFIFAKDDFLSGRHLELEVRDGKCFVTDLESRNGVYLRIAEPTPVAPGQLLLLGETLVRFEVV